MENLGFTFVNFSHLSYKGYNLLDGPFILASQTKRVYSIKDERDKGWLVIKCAKLRDVFIWGYNVVFHPLLRITLKMP